MRLHRLAPCAPLPGAKTTSHELPLDLESVLTSSAVSVSTLLSVVVSLQFTPDFSVVPRHHVRGAGGWLAPVEVSPSVLPLRGFDEVVALFCEFPDYSFYVSILGNRPMYERGRICTVALAAENDQPLVASIPEYDVVVAISHSSLSSPRTT